MSPGLAIKLVDAFLVEAIANLVSITAADGTFLMEPTRELQRRSCATVRPRSIQSSRADGSCEMRDESNRLDEIDPNRAMTLRWRDWLLLGPLVVFMICGIQGCGTDSCNNLQKGRTYSFELRESGPFDRGHPLAQPPCAEGTDLRVGDSVLIRVDREVEDERDGCMEARGELASEPPFPRSDAARLIAFPTTMAAISAAVAVDWDGCPADWAVSVNVWYDNDALAPYNAGNPNAILARGLYPHSFRDKSLAAACEGKSMCANNWGVHVAEVR